MPICHSRTFSLYESLDFVLSYFRMNRLIQKINILDLFSWNGAQSADEQSVASYGRSVALTRTVRDALSMSTRAVYGAESKRMSLLFHLLYCKSAGSFLDLIQARGNGAQAFRIKGGAQQISIKMAAELDDRLRLSTGVKKIETSEDGPTRVTLECKRLVLAIPPNQCAKLEFSPPLGYLKRRLFDSMEPGHFIKFVVTFATAFWRDDGLSGEIASTGRTTVPGEDLVRFLGEKALREFIAYEEKNWKHEPYNGGCPVDHVTPGNMDAFVTIRDMHYGVHFAGTETAIAWMGYMSGAVESGKRAANEVLHALGVDHNYLKGSQLSADCKRPQAPRDQYE
ncbi:hypothetical protein PRIPAC_73677, partial [Pristionchus pacificus]|uniref:monoamine oxidase n=1 Tax=Pristionchus pacificus TaxID=54126 RepID=A0A2A6C0Y5_PRIPA